MTTTPETFYFVTCNFSRAGWGNAGDATAIHSEAYDQYADAVMTGQTHVTVWMVETTADGKRTITDITEEMEAALAIICELRGIELELTE